VQGRAGIDNRAVRALPLLVLAGLVAVPAAWGGREAAVKRLAVGDAVFVAGTQVLCAVTDRPKAISCFKVNASGPAPGTYAVGLDANGTAAAWRISANGTPKPVLTRKLQGRLAKQVTLRRGEVARISGTRVDCAVVRPRGSGNAIFCAFDDAKGPVPGSYAVALTDAGAVVSRIDRQRKPRNIWAGAH
jgi:hypothetical protein